MIKWIKSDIEPSVLYAEIYELRLKDIIERILKEPNMTLVTKDNLHSLFFGHEGQLKKQDFSHQYFVVPESLVSMFSATDKVNKKKGMDKISNMIRRLVSINRKWDLNFIFVGNQIPDYIALSCENPEVWNGEWTDLYNQYEPKVRA